MLERLLTILGLRRGRAETAPKARLGRWGEKKAEKYLKRRGYKLIKRNYATRRGEVDLIMRRRGVVVFVEVKTRTSEDFASGESAVNYGKQLRIERAAKDFIRQRQLEKCVCRFDVVVLVRPVKGKVTVRHWESAFRVKGGG